MAHGVPVVATNAGPLPEILGDAALLVAPGDAAALARAMGRLLSDGALRVHLRARGHAVAAHYTWDGCAAQTLEIYQGVRGKG
jgi:glycosyltransferase involved in cell wall biosynthesis